jgi:protein-tyrosine phosphatase
MIDIHCHIIPGVDDGPQEMRETIEMARQAAADGITDIVATPHVNGSYGAMAGEEERSRAGFEVEVALVNQRIRAAGVWLTVWPGAEIAHQCIDGADLSALGLNGTRYVLVEFPHTHLPADAAGVIRKLLAGGYLPIVAHPERNPSIIERPKELMALRELGALAQITAGSLTQPSDPDVLHCALYLLKKLAVDFIASDAHSAAARPPVLTAAFKETVKLLGVKPAKALFSAHPLAVLAGKAIQRLDR